jgi:acetyl-CoA carboxylase biotin carboxyl carrier protein
MDIKKIKKLIELLENSQLSGLEIQEGDTGIKLTREIHHHSRSINYEHHVIEAPKNLAVQETLSKTELIDPHHYVRSPMVGTFYRSTAPDKPPLVTIGDQVKIGDTLCVIEAMKILNFIQADKNGCIKSILVNNAEPVEFEQPLFVIE